MNKEQKIFALIPKIMAEIGSIEKGRKNLSQGYNFRGIDDIYLSLQKPLAKHGVFFAPEVLTNVREERQTKQGGTLIYTVLTVRFTFYADDGSRFDVVTIGEAMDSGDKSANKAMSAALKYCILQLFCIPTQDDNDTENHSPEPLPKNSAPKPGTTAALKPAAEKQKPLATNNPLTLPPCEACGVTLALSKAGTGYFCPDFKKPLDPNSEKPVHTRFPVEKLDEYKHYLSVVAQAPQNLNQLEQPGSEDKVL